MTRYRQRGADNPLRDLLAWCGSNGIPRVFWNKEDPANFDVFKDVAAEFDFVFTTDAASVPRYRAVLGHDRVYTLPFAAQPAIHNPTLDGIRRDLPLCFAGSWRPDKYPARVADTAMLLDVAMDRGLHVYDRFHGTPDGEGKRFPPQYGRAVQGSLDYDRMLTAYRSYQVFLNVNSVHDSPTMFSRRVFELLACKSPIVSSESAGIRQTFGSLVKVARDPSEARAAIAQLLDDADRRERFAHAGYRVVQSEHTYSHRLAAILRTIGVPAAVEEAPLVSLVAEVTSVQGVPELLDTARRQTHAPIELVLTVDPGRISAADVRKCGAGVDGVVVLELPGTMPPGERRDQAIARSRGAWLAFLGGLDCYGAHFVFDSLLAVRFTDAAIIGKRTTYCFVRDSDEMLLRQPGQAHRHVQRVASGTLLVRRDVFDDVHFAAMAGDLDAAFQAECVRRGLRIYSSDPYNYLAVLPHMSSAELGDDHRHVRQMLDLGLVMI
ncbi:MAG: glycosyltransferase [Deltaproteobacteria bacterium]|nr:glycosyltransferase [Deltaproteobacteria bacterium]